MKPTKQPIKMTHIFVTEMPAKDQLKDQTIYISLEYNTVLHKCACGCGKEVCTPITPRDWKLIYDGQTITIHPSIGNWQYPCRSHYIIRNDMAICVFGKLKMLNMAANKCIGHLPA
jgi:hypothetical protein